MKSIGANAFEATEVRLVYRRFGTTIASSDSVYRAPRLQGQLSD